MLLSEYLLNSCANQGISDCFGIPGVHNIALYRGLKDAGLTHYAGRHEQALGFMADGYYRRTKKIALVFTITGAGLTNLLTSMGQAHNDSSAMLVIATTNDSDAQDGLKGDLHEWLNQSDLTKSVAKHNYCLKDKAQLPDFLRRIFMGFCQDRPQPACLHIPKSMLDLPCDFIPLPKLEITSIAAHEQALDQLANNLMTAKRPLIIVGGGAVAAAPIIKQIAETLNAPVVMTVNGRGVLSKQHALALSISLSLRAVRDYVNKADYILAIGTEWGRTDYDMYGIGDYQPHANLAAINLSAEHLARHPNLDLPIRAECKDALMCLLPKLKPKHQTTAVDFAQAGQKLMVQEIEAMDLSYRRMIHFLCLLDQIAPDLPIIGDSTQVIYAGNLNFGRDKPQLYFNAATGYGALGFGLPASIGAILASQKAAICICGDGGLQFTLAELGLAAQLNLPLILLVWNNQGFGEIKMAMEAALIPPIGTDITPPDFQKLAESYSIRAYAPQGKYDFIEVLQQAIKANAPILIEIGEENFQKWDI